jgi:hypothetical protein
MRPSPTRSTADAASGAVAGATHPARRSRGREGEPADAGRAGPLLTIAVRARTVVGSGAHAVRNAHARPVADAVGARRTNRVRVADRLSADAEAREAFAADRDVRVVGDERARSADARCGLTASRRCRGTVVRALASRRRRRRWRRRRGAAALALTRRRVHRLSRRTLHALTTAARLTVAATGSVAAVEAAALGVVAAVVALELAVLLRRVRTCSAGADETPDQRSPEQLERTPTGRLLPEPLGQLVESP